MIPLRKCSSELHTSGSPDGMASTVKSIRAWDSALQQHVLVEHSMELFVNIGRTPACENYYSSQCHFAVPSFPTIWPPPNTVTGIRTFGGRIPITTLNHIQNLKTYASSFRELPAHFSRAQRSPCSPASPPPQPSSPPSPPSLPHPASSPSQ